MAFPLGRAPTLGEFVAKAVEHGAEVKHTPTVMNGPSGRVRFAYLWIESTRFVPLPDMSYDEVLAPDIVDHLARRLQIATSEFWPGFEGFSPPDE